jgi:hypothetical protein
MRDSNVSIFIDIQASRERKAQHIEETLLPGNKQRIPRCLLLPLVGLAEVISPAADELFENIAQLRMRNERFNDAIAAVRSGIRTLILPD